MVLGVLAAGCGRIGHELLDRDGGRECDEVRYRWDRMFGGSGDDEGAGVAVDGAGGVVVTGELRRTVDLGGGPRASAGFSDVFVLALDAACP